MIKKLSQNATFVLAATTIFCVLLFLATLKLPRVDNQLVGSDGIRYFSYLPSLWLDGDLDLMDEYLYFVQNGGANLPVDSGALTANDVPPNQWPFGPTLFWTPFFLLAHASATLLNVFGQNMVTDGMNNFYQSFVLVGNILYGGLGLWFTYRFAQCITSKQAALLATLLIALAGNFIYYMTAEPYMAHNLSLLLSGLFFYVWYKRHTQIDWQTSLILGFIGGLMALVRPQDGLFLGLPFLAQLPGVWLSFRGRPSRVRWQDWLGNCLLAAFTALAVFSVQFWVWGQIYGSYFTNPYLYQEHDTLFFWYAPKLGKVLFSAQRGLFVWHPIYLLALIGLWFTYRRERMFVLMGLIGYSVQWYIISSWHEWMQGDAFGGRMFIVCTPIFVLGLASLCDWLATRLSWRTLYILGALFLAWNFLLFIEYRFDLVTANQTPTWYDLTIRRILFPIEFITRRLG